MAGRTNPLTWLILHLPGRHLPVTPTDQAYDAIWPTTRRGLKLWGLALLFLVRGIQFVAAPNPAMHDALVTFEWLPVPVLGAAVIVVSVYAGWMAYCHHGRDRYGYVALSIVAATMTLAYLTSIALLGAPGYAWGGVSAWGITMWLVYIMAGDPDPAIESGVECG